MKALEVENFKEFSIENSVMILGGVVVENGTGAGEFCTNQGCIAYSSDSGGTPNTFYGISYLQKPC